MENKLQLVPKENNSVFTLDKTAFQEVYGMANVIAQSDLVPDTYKKKPENCIIAIDVARNIGLSPLTVMQNLHIIKGKPSWSATFIAGAIKKRYKRTQLIMSGDGVSKECKLLAYDKEGNIIAEGAPVSMQMAKDEGWIDKAGSKWKTMPELMLQYRANAFFGRVHCPDLLIGLPDIYESEDIVFEREKPFDALAEHKKLIEESKEVEKKENIQSEFMQLSESLKLCKNKSEIDGVLYDAEQSDLTEDQMKTLKEKIELRKVELT